MALIINYCRVRHKHKRRKQPDPPQRYGSRAEFLRQYFPEHPLPDPSAQETEPPEAQKLALYINKENLYRYLSLIGECRSATELARVVVEMVEQEPRLFPEEMVKERFISLLLPFASKLEKGKTVDNIRARINDAWMNRPKKRP